MSKTATAISLAVALLVTPAVVFSQTINVKESISGTNLRIGTDLNGDGRGSATLGMCYGKGTLGQYTCKTYGETFVVPIGLGDPCDPGWLYAELREVEPGTGNPSVFGHVQEFKTGELLYWVPDWSKTSYYCFDTAPTGKLTLKQYLKYDGGTGRFRNASGTIEWNFEVDTRIDNYMWGVEGSVQGILNLDNSMRP